MRRVTNATCSQARTRPLLELLLAGNAIISTHKFARERTLCDATYEYSCWSKPSKCRVDIPRISAPSQGCLVTSRLWDALISRRKPQDINITLSMLVLRGRSEPCLLRVRHPARVRRTPISHQPNCGCTDVQHCRQHSSLSMSVVVLTCVDAEERRYVVERFWRSKPSLRKSGPIESLMYRLEHSHPVQICVPVHEIPTPNCGTLSFW